MSREHVIWVIIKVTQSTQVIGWRGSETEANEIRDLLVSLTKRPNDQPWAWAYYFVQAVSDVVDDPLLNLVKENHESEDHDHKLPPGSAE